MNPDNSAILGAIKALENAPDLSTDSFENTGWDHWDQWFDGIVCTD